AVPLLGDPRKDRLDLAQERAGEAGDGLRVRRVALERSERHAAPGVLHQDAGGAVLGTRHVPRVLVTGVAEGRTVADAPQAGLVPVARVELKLQLRVDAVAELGDRRLLERVEA